MNAEQCVQGKGDLILLMLRVGLLIVVEDMTFDALLLPLTVGCYNRNNSSLCSHVRGSLQTEQPILVTSCSPSILLFQGEIGNSP